MVVAGGYVCESECVCLCYVWVCVRVCVCVWRAEHRSPVSGWGPDNVENALLCSSAHLTNAHRSASAHVRSHTHTHAHSHTEWAFL
jgi:hypothetical protein